MSVPHRTARPHCATRAATAPALPRRAVTALLTTLALLAVLALAGCGGGTPSRPADACGPAIDKRPGVPWTCTFADDFSGTALDPGKWVAQVTADSGYTSGKTACFVDRPDTVAVGGGVLRLTARKEAAPFTCADPSGAFITQHTSGMVSTFGRFSQAYGRFEIRAKVPGTSVPGLQESFWLYPSDPMRYGPWPGSGEIDIAEIYSRYADRAIPYVHYTAAAPDAYVTTSACRIADVDAFHTYAVEWTTSTIKVIYDGRTCLVDRWNPAAPLRRPQPFDQPFIVALTQALGVGTNAFSPTATPLPATTQVDYVRVWR